MSLNCRGLRKSFNFAQFQNRILSFTFFDSPMYKRMPLNITGLLGGVDKTRGNRRCTG